ncbi:iron complex transport system permease protein [Luteibacter rhizovicinus]|uniref:Iron complex transport system permease protein n=1 Tax=Luteibacter rhizovicinus TaxID=242606 RepID=A0A4R3YT54_9GAMM|nr:iron ABC transporter permease [Luteibacter rhizovicinus]TCV96195.1 iron complex transport system permease protein [Luteibacter rhizovicinus]
MNAIPLPRATRHGSRRWSLPLLGLLLSGTALWSLTTGAMDVPAREVAGAIGRWFAGADAIGDDRVVLMLRLPRLLLGVIVGASLASSGATMQGLFRNPLADPGLIGVSAGAALGAVAAIVLGGSGHSGASSFVIAACAFVGGLVTTGIVYGIGRRRPGVANLLLAGVAINAIAMAGVGLLTFLANENQLRDLTFWSLGSLGGADWMRLGVVAPWIVVPLVLLPRVARALNAMLLGENEASLLGFRPERLQPVLILLVALAVGASVAMTGVVGFVGLVVPHLLRMVWGPDHRLLLPASAIGGAALLVAADTLARSVVAPAELPIGVLTAIVGGPFFFWLLLRNRVGEGVQ